MSDTSSQVLNLAAQIVSAHVAHNAVPADALPALIQSVFNSLNMVGMQASPPEMRQPTVPIKQSVFPDYIVCLEDGKRLKTLKRHISTAFNMTPEQYRARWGLAHDYPMVAPNYAKIRSSLAKQSGLGHSRAKLDEAAASPAKPARRGRPAGKLLRAGRAAS